MVGAAAGTITRPDRAASSSSYPYIPSPSVFAASPPPGWDRSNELPDERALPVAIFHRGLIFGFVGFDGRAVAMVVSHIAELVDRRNGDDEDDGGKKVSSMEGSSGRE